MRALRRFPTEGTTTHPPGLAPPLQCSPGLALLPVTRGLRAARSTLRATASGGPGAQAGRPAASVLGRSDQSWWRTRRLPKRGPESGAVSPVRSVKLLSVFGSIDRSAETKLGRSVEPAWGPLGRPGRVSC